jgi:hypothetical protein
MSRSSVFTAQRLPSRKSSPQHSTGDLSHRDSNRSHRIQQGPGAGAWLLTWHPFWSSQGYNLGKTEQKLVLGCPQPHICPWLDSGKRYGRRVLRGQMKRGTGWEVEGGMGWRRAGSRVGRGWREGGRKNGVRETSYAIGRKCHVRQAW